MGDGRSRRPRGVEPRWSRDGRELFYRADAALYRVAIDSARGFFAGRPEPFFDRVASGGGCSPTPSRRTASGSSPSAPPQGGGAQRTLDLDLGFARRLADSGNHGK